MPVLTYLLNFYEVYIIKYSSITDIDNKNFKKVFSPQTTFTNKAMIHKKILQGIEVELTVH
jgi:hypothetical protein